MMRGVGWLAGLPAALARLCAYRRLIRTGLADRDLKRNPDSHRRRLAFAARAAFLDTLAPNQRAIAQRPYGDQI